MSEPLPEYADPAAEDALDVDLTPEPTGNAAVDAVVSSLRGLDELPVADHVAVFEHAHETLRRALSQAGDEAAGSTARRD